MFAAVMAAYVMLGAELPRLLDVITWWFPLRHFSAAFPAGSARLHRMDRVGAPLLIALLIGVVAFAGLGLAVVALMPDAGAVPAVALGLFMPLAFISDMLTFGIRMPPVLSDIGWIFPLKRLMHAVDDAFASSTVAIDHLGVVELWGTLGALVAVERFRWAPR